MSSDTGVLPPVDVERRRDVRRAGLSASAHSNASQGLLASAVHTRRLDEFGGRVLLCVTVFCRGTALQAWRALLGRGEAVQSGHTGPCRMGSA